MTVVARGNDSTGTMDRASALFVFHSQRQGLSRKDLKNAAFGVREGDAPVLGDARVDARELRERDERDEPVGRGQARVREVLRGGDGGGVRRLADRREEAGERRRKTRRSAG